MALAAALSLALVQEVRAQACAGAAALPTFDHKGVNEAAARLHFARTVCRRAERRIAALAASGARLNPDALKYANRLSDLLFVMARTANLDAGGDVLWVPGKDR